MRYFYILSSALILSVLAACGGGGGSATTSSTSPYVYFIEVNNAFNVNYPINTTSNINATAIDINGDGKLDMVFHFQGQGSGSSVTPNQISIYIQQSNGVFIDQTSQYLMGSTDLGGASRKAKVIDINGDGKPDILFAVNQEDGRVITNSSDANAQMAALVSVANIYKIVLFGTPNWYHSVGYGYDSNGRPFVTGNGYSTQSVGSFYLDSLGNISLTGLNTPIVSPTSFEFFSTNSNAQTDLLLQANNTTTNYMAVEGYQILNGNWTQLQSISLAPQIGNVNAIGYDGQSQGLAPVFNANGNAITFAGLSETCQIKLTPSSDKIILFKISGAAIPSFTDGMTVSQNSLSAFQTIKGATIRNGVITISPFTIVGEQTNNVNANFFDCQDVNGDNYSDIVVYPYNNTGLPYVYLNDKNGGFVYINQDKFPQVILDSSWGTASTSILKDFDGDQIPDLLIFPGNGLTPSNPVKYRFFKGERYLQ